MEITPGFRLRGFAIDDVKIEEAYSYSNPTNAEPEEMGGHYYFLGAIFSFFEDVDKSGL